MLGRSPRTLAFWIAALVIAVVTATTVASDLASLHRRAGSLGPEEPALVAARDLPTGAVLGGGDVTVRRVHRSQLPPGALTDRSAVDDRVVASPVLRGGFVVARNLAPRRRDGLDGVVPEGTRAMRVEVARPAATRVGAAVDVLASYGASTDGAGETVVIAAGALVLATDRDATPATGRAGSGLTLLVSADEARAVADAQANGVLTVAVVPPEEAARLPRPDR